MVSLSPTSVNVQTIVMGNILAVTPADTAQLAIIAGVTLAILLLKWRDLMAVFFDEPYARSIGLPARALKVLFFALLAASTVAALLTVGAFLVIAMVVTPGATAYLLTDRFGRLCALACGDRRRLRGSPAPISATSSTAPPAASSSCCRPWSSSSRWSSRRSTACWPPAAAAARRCAERPALPFDFDFMQRAFVVTAVVAVPMALLSCLLVLRGWSLMGDAISHAVLPGIVVAYWLGAPLALGAFAAGMLCAGGDRLREGEQPGQGGHRHGHRLLRHVRARGRALRRDADRRAPRPHPLRRRRSASPGPTSARAPRIAAAGRRSPCCVGRRGLLLHAFDPAHARAIGLPVRLLHYGLLALVALTVVAALQAVGIILAIAVLIAPGAIAFLWVPPLRADAGGRGGGGGRRRARSASTRASGSTPRRRRPSSSS